jgi:hypothetical protein
LSDSDSQVHCSKFAGDLRPDRTKEITLRPS